MSQWYKQLFSFAHTRTTQAVIFSKDLNLTFFFFYFPLKLTGSETKFNVQQWVDLAIKSPCCTKIIVQYTIKEMLSKDILITYSTQEKLQ